MAVERFGRFKLDTDTRQLTLDGAEIPLQPRIFDLLAYLVENRDRVVDKDELLSRVWPGVIVTEASLQRAVSLARGALRQGGLAEAIRTYPRRGYRFCPDEGDRAGPATPADSLTMPELARGFYAKRRWHEAASMYAAADGRETLHGADLERWGLAVLSAGAPGDAVAALERAATAYCEGSDAQGCARVSIVLAQTVLEARQVALANGHLRRAGSLLEDLPLCEQHGHLQWTWSRYWLYMGDLAQSAAHARHTLQIAHQLGSPDLDAMGKLYLGVAEQALGNLTHGLGLQDEAAAAVLAGQVSPMLGGIVYCGILAGSASCGDWARAAHWTSHFHRWCRRTRQMNFAASCLLHRAEVFIVRGEFDRALQELVNGRGILEASGAWALGDASRTRGDVHLARGEFAQAEAAYRLAHEHGRPPYPGYAMLLHYRGQSAAAVRGLCRALESGDWLSGQRTGLYLALQAIIAAQSGDLEAARKALERLDSAPAIWNEGGARACVAHARGEIALACDDPEQAIRHMQEALLTWTRLDSPLDTARLRLRLAHALQQIGDTAHAELELATATSALRRWGANGYLSQVGSIRGDAGAQRRA